MTTKLTQDFASSDLSETEATTRTPAADTNLSVSAPNCLDRKTAGIEKTAAAHSFTEADRRPAGSPGDLSPIQQAKALADLDFANGTDWRVSTFEFIRNYYPSPIEIAIYQRAYFNCWLRSEGLEELILDLKPAAGEAN